MNLNNFEQIELIVITDKNQQDAAFWQTGNMYRELHLSDPEEEEYYVGDNPILESISITAQG